jgi:hypothetical protein
VKLSRRAALAAVVFSLASALAAQESGLRDRDRTFEASRTIAEQLRRARYHYGPFYLLSNIQLGDVGIDQTFFVPTADQSGGGISFSVSAPTRLYYVPQKKTIFSVEVTPQYTRFRRGVTRDTLGYLTRADAQFLLNHLYLDAYYSKSHLLRADIGELARLVDIRNDQVGLTGELRWSSRTSINFSATDNRIAYPKNSLQPQVCTPQGACTDLAVQLLDRAEHNYRVALQHHTFALTSLIAASEWSNYSFSSSAYANATRTYEGVGFIYDSGLTLLRAEAGPAKLNFKRPDQHDFNGALGNLAATRRHTRIWHSTVNASRDTNFSIFQGNNYYIADRAAFTTQLDVTRHLTLDASGTVGEDLYQTPVAPTFGGPTLLRRDKIQWVAVGWTYGLRRIRGGFDVGYVRRTSNFKVDQQNGIRVIIRLSLTP